MDINLSKGILITGGTGTFGKAFLKHIITKYSKIPRIVIYSRDEYKQWEMMNDFPSYKYPQIRFFLGDIRDLKRFSTALSGIDIVVHAAALKQVPAAEYNPIEFIRTNVLGTENVVQASLESNVKKVISLSTDKAAAPINLYGATKLCADKLVVAANNISGSKDITFSVVRYGNVLGSRGSVIPYFIEQAKNGLIPITDLNMTRFNITITQAVEFVLNVLKNSLGGEIFVPKLPSYRIKDVADAIGPNCEHKIIGVRDGEKIHEEMITFSDSPSTIDLGNRYAILPPDGELLKKYEKEDIDFKRVPKGFSYNSLNNHKFFNKQEIRKLIVDNLDAKFLPN